jgi:hypothetical protein
MICYRWLDYAEMLVIPVATQKISVLQQQMY